MKKDNHKHKHEFDGRDLTWGIVPKKYGNLLKKIQYGVKDKMTDAASPVKGLSG